jgi:hypothetical protein
MKNDVYYQFVCAVVNRVVAEMEASMMGGKHPSYGDAVQWRASLVAMLRVPPSTPTVDLAKAILNSPRPHGE